jgi:glycerate 2-kinase
VVKVLIAPDCFGDVLTAVEAAEAIERGWRRGRPDDALTLAPQSDGGPGFVGVLAGRLGEMHTLRVSGPLTAEVSAQWVFDPAPPRTAYIECAQACGLALLGGPPTVQTALAAHSRGVGQLIAAAVEAGAERVVVTVGGSATTDGGAGALEALEEAGVTVELDVLCDVRTPFEQAPSVFGPQKGAGPEMVKRLEQRLDELAARLPRDPRSVPMTGAAGGLSGGLWARHGANLQHGASFVLDTIGFDERMREAAFVVTGEGRIDSQTLQGKIVGELATRCRQGGVACHALVGKNELDDFSARILDLASLREATTLEELEEGGCRMAG